MCIKGICSNDIENAIEIQMKKRNCPMENEEAYVEPEPVFGVEDYVKRFGKIRGLNDVGFNNNTDI